MHNFAQLLKIPVYNERKKHCMTLHQLKSADIQHSCQFCFLHHFYFLYLLFLLRCRARTAAPDRSGLAH